MKIKQFFKKAAATVMAAVTVLSLLPTTAFAATGDVGTISFTRTYDSAGNAMYYNSSAVINGYTAGGTGKNKYRMYVDGSTAFCIQPGVPLKTGNQLTENSSETWNALSASQKKAVGLALLYGYQGNRDGLTGSDDEKWLATQTLVWEFVTGCRNSTGSFAQTDTTVYSLHFGSNYPNSGARAAYDQIVSMLTKHNTVPSFMNGSTRDLEYKDGQYVLTLTDTNGVLSEYSFSSSDRNVSVSKSGNTLTISSANAFSGSVRITATRNNIPVVSESAKLIAYGDPNLQDLVTGVENTDGVSAYLNVETPTGTIGLKKTSEDGKVEGITFTVEGNGIQQTVKTNAAGEILIDGLTPGVYTVTEQSYEKYEPQSVQRVTVIGGRTSIVTFNNVLKRGDLTVTKTSEDGLVEGMKFHLYGTSLSGIAVDEYAVTDSSGKAYFKDVLIGSGYVLEEVDTPIRYVVPESQTAAVEWNTVTEKSVSNVLKKWNATVTKSDRETGTAQGNAYLAGATYGIYKGDQLVDTYTTDANGQFITAYYVCDDDWSIREISPSEGYLLDETSYHVGAEPQLYTVEYNSAANDVNEQVIKGSIALIKHTDDGETKLETPEAGAEFSVYLKSSGSYDAAKDSERDTLICDENGFAQTKQLPYGIYTVHQVSGWEGRELLADFDVYIAKDGQVYRYLANNANFESYIKVIKVDAETGKTIPYAGAGFQIYRPDGSKVEMTFTYPTPTTIDTFYTNDEGYLVTPEKLEYGSGYSLVEVSAPYGYVLNSDPVTFDVTADNATEESSVTVVEVTKSNMAQKGIIKISKSGEVFAAVTESDGLYQPVYEVQGLPGAVYEITAAEDVVTLDGTLRYSAGEVVDGDRADSENPDRADHGADGESRGRDGGAESQRPDEMDGPDEQPPALSGGDSAGRTDLQLTEQNSEADSAELPAFLNERLIMAIVANKDDDLKYKKQQIELYFSIHPEETDRAEYLKSAYQDRYTEILVDGVRVGYKPQADGLLMWEGAYLSRTSESVFSWGVVAGWTAQLIEKKEYFINTKITPPKSYDSQQLSLFDFADFNNPAQEDGGQISFMSRPELPQQVIDEALCIGANDRNSRLIICAYFMKDHTPEENAACGSQKTGTRAEAVYSVRAGQGSCHLWNGVDAGPVQYRTGRHLYHHAVGGLRCGTADGPANGNCHRCGGVRLL